MTTTLKMMATDTGGNDVTTTISYANPEATDAVLSDFAQACNGLTTNTYVDTLRIDSTSLNASTNS